MTAEHAQRAVSLLDYLRVLQRRKLVLLSTVVLVPAVAVLLSSLQSPTYSASAQVLLRQETPSTVITGGQAPYVDPARAAQTQADVARVLEVTRRVVQEAGVPGLTVKEFLKASTVTTTAGSDLLTFTVDDSDPEVANRLATAYAQTFVEYRHGLDVQELASARRVAEERKRDLEAGGLQSTLAYQNLVQSLAAMDAYESQRLRVLRSADEAVQVGPSVVRNGMVALTLGLVLGVVLAFLWDVLDTRVRSLDRIRSGLEGLRLLGRIPAPPRDLRKLDALVMTADPTSEDAEAFRVLRANFDLVTAETGARTVMVTSAVGAEGKSTTVANLAVALARSGRRVVLIDADLRSPHLHRLFDVAEAPGLSDVAVLDIDVDQALVEVTLDELSPLEQEWHHGSRREGTLELIPAGRALGDPDELNAEVAISRIVEDVKRSADFILIDAGPLLPTGDAIALSTYVDAILLVVRLNTLSSSALDDLAAALASSPAMKLGFVLTGADSKPHRHSQHSGATRRRSASAASPVGPSRPEPVPDTVANPARAKWVVRTNPVADEAEAQPRWRSAGERPGS